MYQLLLKTMAYFLHNSPNTKWFDQKHKTIFTLASLLDKFHIYSSLITSNVEFLVMCNIKIRLKKLPTIILSPVQTIVDYIYDRALSGTDMCQERVLREIEAVRRIETQVLEKKLQDQLCRSNSFGSFGNLNSGSIDWFEFQTNYVMAVSKIDKVLKN